MASTPDSVSTARTRVPGVIRIENMAANSDSPYSLAKASSTEA